MSTITLSKPATLNKATNKNKATFTPEIPVPTGASLLRVEQDVKSLHTRIDKLIEKVDTNFRWVLGIILGSFVGIITLILVLHINLQSQVNNLQSQINNLKDDANSIKISIIELNNEIKNGFKGLNHKIDSQSK